MLKNCVGCTLAIGSSKQACTKRVAEIPRPMEIKNRTTEGRKKKQKMREMGTTKRM
jgi:hypothetical protein